MFTLRFFTENTAQNICDILAFALPTLAAIVERIIAEKGNKKFADELKKRPPIEYLSEEEYERRKKIIAAYSLMLIRYGLLQETSNESIQ